MRVVALDTVHVLLDHGMVIRELEFGVSRQMAVETRRRITARIVDELPSAACRDVPAPGPVAGFATGIAAARHVAQMNPCVRACHERPDVVGVTIQTCPVAGVMSARNLWRHVHRARCSSAGVQ